MVLLRLKGGATVMSIEYRRGNLLEDDAEALVITVNCVGVMGKGIALQFKHAYPRNYVEYEKACKREELQPGKMFIHDTGDMFNQKLIINFPTKRHWKGKARLEDIESGLVSLVADVKRLGIKSIAIPPLGCGNGGLPWEVVKPRIEAAFRSLNDVSVRIYEPVGSPINDEMPINTSPPEMTRSRAILLALMDFYAVAEHRLSLLEVQKLAYFLQVSGEPLKLNFQKGQYGPYAENLNFVLQRLEGHFIRGYGDRSRDAQIKILPIAKIKVQPLLQSDNEASIRLKRVSDVILGFESPYGLELLSTVHWCAIAASGRETPVEDLVKSIHCWSQRKHSLFTQEHICKAWAHIKDFDFLWEARAELVDGTH